MKRFFVYLMGVLGAALFLFTTDAAAVDMDRPLESGVITARVQTAPNSGDVLFTRSVSVVRIDTGESVLCLNSQGLGDEILVGPTQAILNLGSDVFLEAYAHSELGCTGAKSPPSSDRYRVLFAGPEAPVLLMVVDPE